MWTPGQQRVGRGAVCRTALHHYRTWTGGGEWEQAKTANQVQIQTQEAQPQIESDSQAVFRTRIHINPHWYGSPGSESRRHDVGINVNSHYCTNSHVWLFKEKFYPHKYVIRLKFKRLKFEQRERRIVNFYFKVPWQTWGKWQDQYWDHCISELLLARTLLV